MGFFWTDIHLQRIYSVIRCHMKTRPYVRNLYLMKENEEKHQRHTLNNIEENIDINIEKSEKLE